MKCPSLSIYERKGIIDYIFQYLYRFFPDLVERKKDCNEFGEGLPFASVAICTGTKDICLKERLQCRISPRCWTPTPKISAPAKDEVDGS
jgi:hypothetical protein